MKMRIFIFAILALMLGVSSNHLRADEVQFASTTDASYVQRLEAIEAELAELRESGGGGDAFDCDCANTPGLMGGMDLTLMMPHTGSLRASVTPPGGQIAITPNYDVQAAPRVWLGYRNSDGLGVRARYWQLNSQAVSVFFVPLINSVEAQAFDFEVTQTAKVGRWELDLSGGIRWGLIENGIDAGPGILSLFQNMEGTGPTIAIGARRPVGCRNLSIYGNARASLLFGDNDFSASGFLIPAPPGTTLTLSADNSVMQVYEVQLGTEWSKQLSNGGTFFARAGLEAQVWDVPGLALGLLDQNIGFVGGVFSLGINR